MHRLAFALVIALVSCAASGQSQVLPSVHSVLSGGYWQSGGQAGTYRVVVVNQGWEHVTSRVFIEWLREPRDQNGEQEVVSSVEPELPFGKGVASMNARLKPLATGKVQVVLSGVMATDPSRRVRAVLLATSPGVVIRVAANSPVEQTVPGKPGTVAHVKR